MTKIAIVGNAPSDVDYADDIDASELVVRFNNAYGFEQHRGSRIDDLYLVNCGGQPLEWLQTEGFWDQSHIVATPHITLPIASGSEENTFPSTLRAPSDNVDGLNFEIAMRVRLEGMGKTVRTLPFSTYLQACELVSGPRSATLIAEPSTGFLAIYHYLKNTGPDDVITLFGFGFAGWQGHAWHRERAWVEHRQYNGRLVWHA